jgi:hypothetical protein
MRCVLYCRTVPIEYRFTLGLIQVQFDRIYLKIRHT